MGHLDPARLLEAPAVLERAFLESPMPHRFPATATRWVLDAARRVVDVYGGDAARIWDGGLRAIEIRTRLEAFQGIGQKKAAMAVEILATHLGVPMTGMTDSDVAYDIHVRRVFRRTGLVEVDTIDAIVTAARTLHPARPGLLDVPAWTVGREWCRPRRPRCTECPISWACPSAPVPDSTASA
jgi:endonuclease III